MGRKKVEINPECGKRLSLLLNDHEMQQKQLAEALNYTPQQISRIITGKDRLTEEFARKVIEYFKTGNKETDMFDIARFEWLMCYDNYKTLWDQMRSIARGKDEIRALISRLMQLCGYEIVEKAFPVNTKRFTKEELEAFEKRPYQHVCYALESHRQDRDMIYRVLDNSEVERIYTDIFDFVEFTCSKHMKRPGSDYLSTRKGDE